jgi:hypothetical protein
MTSPHLPPIRRHRPHSTHRKEVLPSSLALIRRSSLRGLQQLLFLCFLLQLACTLLLLHQMGALRLPMLNLKTLTEERGSETGDWAPVGETARAKSTPAAQATGSSLPDLPGPFVAVPIAWATPPSAHAPAVMAPEPSSWMAP